MDKECLMCSETYEPIQSTQKFCGADCRNRWWTEGHAPRVIRYTKCLVCFKEFKKYNDNHRYCSNYCRGKAQTEISSKLEPEIVKIVKLKPEPKVEPIIKLKRGPKAKPKEKINLSLKILNQAKEEEKDRKELEKVIRDKNVSPSIIKLFREINRSNWDKKFHKNSKVNGREIDNNVLGDINECQIMLHCMKKGWYAYKNMACTGPIDFFLYNKESDTTLKVDAKSSAEGAKHTLSEYKRERGIKNAYFDHFKQKVVFFYGVPRSFESMEI